VHLDDECVLYTVALTSCTLHCHEIIPFFYSGEYIKFLVGEVYCIYKGWIGPGWVNFAVTLQIRELPPLL
jgi:hypothetical protein